MKVFTFRCRWLSIRIRIGSGEPEKPLKFRRYRVASRDRTSELRDALAGRVFAALKG